MSNLPDTLLKSLGYAVVHPANEFHQLELHGARFKQTFKNAQEAWAYAEADLSRRTNCIDTGVQIRPDYQGEAEKLGFEVTCVPAQQPRHGWRHREVDVCSLRQDYPTAAEAWRAAFMWARRFGVLWKE